MNRNTQSHFSQVPRVDIARSRFDRSSSIKTSFNVGELIPFYVDEVLPGDTFSVDTSKVVRMQTMITPIMDNVYLDTYWFYVPSRILWTHWRELMGENRESAWIPTTEYSVPQVTAPSGGWASGTIADYMGIPTKVEGISVNALQFRGYARIWNEWFRDENLQQPVVQDMDDTTNTGSNTGTQLSDAQNGGMPLKVAKYHDYFTSCLPEPQKGEASIVPIGSGALPVYWADQNQNFITKFNAPGFVPNMSDDTPLGSNYAYGDWNGSSSGNVNRPVNATNAIPPNQEGFLAADASHLSAISINELRQAIAIQHILEADARGGTRYTELLAHEFGVTSPDSRLQRSEYLGGARIPINMNQVIQTSATDETSPQGNVSAYSMTTDVTKMCSYSAVEHGYIFILAAIRVDHSYQQGLSRMWTRKTRFDFYHPLLANLGEMAVLNKEIYCQGNEQDDEVFGYQEAWADYRYHPNIVTGEMRSNYVQSLDSWHYGDYYTKLPTLSSNWIKEGTENIDRTLAVQSENSHQFIANVYFDQTWTRPMPIYSVPGLNTI